MSDLALQTVSVSSATYPAVASPQVDIGWEPDSILLLNRSATATDIVYYSFDGSSDHGILIPGTLPAIEIRGKRKKIWLRRDSGAATTSVNVMANTVR